MKLKASELISRDRCAKKGFFESLSLSDSKGAAFHMAVAVKEVLKGFDFFSKGEAIKILNEMVSDKFYLSKEIKETNITNMANLLQRYFDYESAQGRKSAYKNYMQVVTIDGVEISVTADFIYETEKHIEVVKVKTGTPKISMRGQTFQTSVKTNLELYLLSELGKTLGTKKPVLATLHHLKCKNDNSKVLVDFFEIRKGANIFSNSFSVEESAVMKAHVNKVLSESPSLTTEMETSKDECDFCSFKNLCKYQKPQVITLDRVTEIKKAGDLKLTKAQRDAINFGNGIARLNAGAGSGKSTVIALRVADMLTNGVKAKDILLITFTNKGALEMREKVAYWVKEFGIENVNVADIHIMTFNAWGEMVIKNTHSLLGYSGEPSLVEKVQKYDLIFEVLSENPKADGFDYKNPIMNFPNAKGVVVELDEYFNEMKSNLVLSLAEVKLSNIVSDEKISIVYDLYLQFNKKLKENNLMQYQDQINSLIHLMDFNPEELMKFSYKHIMVDEYQDTDMVQFDVISFLVNLPKFKSLLVVGDTSQSIFGFRNVGPENMLNFNKFFTTSKDLFMTENFRSTPNILRTANALDKLNVSRIEKTITSSIANHKNPELIRCQNVDVEYSHIASKIVSKLAEGYEPQQIAIISRTKSEMYKLEAYLKDLKIPYVLDIPEPLLNNMNFHIMVDFISFFENSENTFALLEFLNIFRSEQIKLMSPEEINEYVVGYKLGFEKRMLTLDSEAEKLDFFFVFMNAICQKDKTIGAFVTELKNRGFKTTEELFSYMRKIVTYEDEKIIESDEQRYNAVALTTAHTAKGKEWDIVFHTLDKYKTSNVLSEIEESRRILFVAITRAKKELYLTYHDNQDKIKNKGTFPAIVNDLLFVDKMIPYSYSKAI